MNAEQTVILLRFDGTYGFPRAHVWRTVLPELSLVCWASNGGDGIAREMVFFVHCWDGRIVLSMWLVNAVGMEMFTLGLFIRLVEVLS